MGLFEGIVVPKVICGCKAWALNARSKKRIEYLK